MPQITFTDAEAAAAVELWSDRPEVKALPDLLAPNERITFIGGGVVAGRFTTREWLVALTDQRLLCVVGTNPITRQVVDVSLASVRTVDCRKGPLRSTVILETGQGKIRIAGLKRSAASELFDALSEPLRARDRARRPNPLTWAHTSAAGQDPSPNIADRTPFVGTSAPTVHHAPPVALDSRIERLEALTESLESEVAQLREQVAFLEELLKEKATH
jgi:hypothetical protein